MEKFWLDGGMACHVDPINVRYLQPSSMRFRVKHIILGDPVFKATRNSSSRNYNACCISVGESISFINFTNPNLIDSWPYKWCSIVV